MSNAHTLRHLELLRPRHQSLAAGAVRGAARAYCSQRACPPAGRVRPHPDVERIQADDDDDEELLICGDDAFGGWVAIAHVDEAPHGANPLGQPAPCAVRTAINRGFRGTQRLTASPTLPTSPACTRRRQAALCARQPDGADDPEPRPGSGLYPGLGDQATPVRPPVPTSQANLPQRRLAMRSQITTRAEERSGASGVGESVVRGPMVRLRTQGRTWCAAWGHAQRSGWPFPLRTAPCALTCRRQLPRGGARIDLTGTRFAARHRLRLRRGRLGGAPQPLPAAGRHRLGRGAGPAALWPAHALGGLVLPHRYTEGCQAQNGRMVARSPSAGTDTSYGEVVSAAPAAPIPACRLRGRAPAGWPGGLRPWRCKMTRIRSPRSRSRMPRRRAHHVQDGPDTGNLVRSSDAFSCAGATGTPGALPAPGRRLPPSAVGGRGQRRRRRL